MNIIEAYYTMKATFKDVGCPGCTLYYEGFKNSTFPKFVIAAGHGNSLSNNWEVVKEKKTIVLEGVYWKRLNSIVYPAVVDEYLIEQISNKTTKLTIEYDE